MMGSCSSGGPNKYTGMCFIEDGASARKDCYSKVIDSEALSVSDSVCGDSSPQISNASLFTVIPDNKGGSKPRTDNNRILVKFQSKVDAGSPDIHDRSVEIQNDRQTTSAECEATERTTCLSPTIDCHHRCISRTKTSWLPSELEYSRTVNQEANSEVLSGVMVPNANSGGAISDHSGPSTNVVIKKPDSRRQQQRQCRKASAPSQPCRWPNEYGTCVIPPPNKTVFDALSSPFGRLDYSLDSGWDLSCTDRKAATDNIHYRPTATSISGYNSDKKTAGLLPISSLPSSTWIFSSCRAGSTTSSSTATDCSSLQHGDSSDDIKRLNSLGSSTAILTSKLLPKSNDEIDICRKEIKDHRPRASTSENRPLASASQRLLSFLSSPMRPLNGGDVSSSTTKYTQLHSESSHEEQDLPRSSLRNSSRINNSVGSSHQEIKR